MFNTRINDTQTSEKELMERAANRARGPGQARGDNASQVSGFISTLTIAPPLPTTTDPVFPPIYPDTVGIDEDGNLWHPFRLGVDTFADTFAYLPTGHPATDYGN